MLKKLLDRIKQLYHDDAIHIKRGYPISTATILTVTNHLLEEAVELQGALFDTPPNTEAILKEAADVLIMYCHMLHRISAEPEKRLADIVNLAIQILDENFTTDPAKVTAVKPGFSRTHRGPAPPPTS